MNIYLTLYFWNVIFYTLLILLTACQYGTLEIKLLISLWLKKTSKDISNNTGNTWNFLVFLDFHFIFVISNGTKRTRQLKTPQNPGKSHFCTCTFHFIEIPDEKTPVEKFQHCPCLISNYEQFKSKSTLDKFPYSKTFELFPRNPKSLQWAVN